MAASYRHRNLCGWASKQHEACSDSQFQLLRICLQGQLRLNATAKRKPTKRGNRPKLHNCSSQLNKAARPDVRRQCAGQNGKKSLPHVAGSLAAWQPVQQCNSRHSLQGFKTHFRQRVVATCAFCFALGLCKIRLSVPVNRSQGKRSCTRRRRNSSTRQRRSCNCGAGAAASHAICGGSLSGALVIFSWHNKELAIIAFKSSEIAKRNAHRLRRDGVGEGEGKGRERARRDEPYLM